MFLLALALAVPLGATSYVRVSDEALVDQAARIAVVRFEAAGPRVERALKGGGEGEILRLNLPAGPAGPGEHRPEGLALRIHGAPVFAAGERALLFLEPAGTSWRPLHLFLGAFHDVEAGGRRIAVRDLSEVREIRVSPDGSAKALPPAAGPGARLRRLRPLGGGAGRGRASGRPTTSPLPGASSPSAPIRATTGPCAGSTSTPAGASSGGPSRPGRRGSPGAATPSCGRRSRPGTRTP